MSNISFKKIKLAFIILLASFFLIYKIDKPFIGHHDWNGVFFGNIANNTLKFGFLKTKFGAVSSFLPQNKTDFSFYTHYPPIFHLLLGLEAKIIGVQEWSMRFLAVIFSLIALFLFYKTVELVFDHKIAFVACLFFIFNPMFLYFGKMPVHEVFGLFFIIFAIYCYIIFFLQGNKRNFFWLVLSLVLACQAVWSGYYLSFLFIVHYYFFKKKKGKKKDKFWLIGLIPLISFLSHIIYTFILTGSWDNGLFATMLFRMQIGDKAKAFSFTLPEYIKHEALWLTVYFTRVLCFFYLIYCLLLVKKIIKRKINFKDSFLLIILIFPFIDIIIFKNVCFIHDYKLYYFLLSIPLLASLSLFWFKKKLEFLWKKNKLITIIIFSLIFGLFITERVKFIKTLLNTSINKSAYDLGLIIKEKSKPGEIILVGSKSWAEFQDLFLNFYGQRKIVYFNPDLESFEKIKSNQAKFVVFINSREKPSQDLLNLLKQDYKSFQAKAFIFFDLKPK